jgi:hypothetical protein
MNQLALFGKDQKFLPEMTKEYNFLQGSYAVQAGRYLQMFLKTL